MAWATEELKQLTEGFPKEIRLKIETVVEAVKTVFGFLKQFGYEIVSIGFPESDASKYWTTITLRSDHAMRELLISYFPYGPRKNPLDDITLSISKGNIGKPVIAPIGISFRKLFRLNVATPPPCTTPPSPAFPFPAKQASH